MTDRILTDQEATSAVVHSLWTRTRFFDEIVAGRKTFEIRTNDRDFRVGDTLWLLGYDHEARELTGRQVERRVSYLTDWGQTDGLVVLALEPVPRPECAHTDLATLAFDGHLENAVPVEDLVRLLPTDGGNLLPESELQGAQRRLEALESFVRDLVLHVATPGAEEDTVASVLQGDLDETLPELLEHLRGVIDAPTGLAGVEPDERPREKTAFFNGYAAGMDHDRDESFMIGVRRAWKEDLAEAKDVARSGRLSEDHPKVADGLRSGADALRDQVDDETLPPNVIACDHTSGRRYHFLLVGSAPDELVHGPLTPEELTLLRAGFGLPSEVQPEINVPDEEGPVHNGRYRAPDGVEGVLHVDEDWTGPRLTFKPDGSKPPAVIGPGIPYPYRELVQGGDRELHDFGRYERLQGGPHGDR